MRNIEVEEVQTPEPDDKRTIFYIKPPVDKESKYFLLVTRGSSPFGGGSTVAFAVDGVAEDADPSGKAQSIRGWRQWTPSNREIVVQFPIGVAYLMVKRADVKLMTPMEVALEQKVEEDEMKAIYKDADSVVPEDDRYPGQFL